MLNKKLYTGKKNALICGKFIRFNIYIYINLSYK